MKIENKLKTILVLSLTIFVGNMVNAQSNQDEVAYMQSIFGMEKKAIVTEFIQIESTDLFWSLYDSYETKRKALGKKRLDLLEEYANNYVGMEDVVTDDLIKQMQIQKKSLDKLIDTYYKKIKKESGSKVAAQFYQLENYILSAVRREVLGSIPIIGELD